MLSVFGGKITTYRKLAEHALERLKPFFPQRAGWTAGACLPGGDIANADFDAFSSDFQRANSWLPADLARHYARLYGTRADAVLAGAGALKELGMHFGGLLYEREVAYLRKFEWARSAEDILDRRTKHGLRIAQSARAALDGKFKAGTTV